MTAQKVLLVDDEEDIREMLRLVLENAGFECIEAEDIDKAFRVVIDESTHLMLLDWMLPGGGGIALLKRLRKTEATQAMPVIMVTARTHEDNLVQCLEAGADDYITKPFAPRSLVARVRALIRRSDTEGADGMLRCAVDIDF